MKRLILGLLLLTCTTHTVLAQQPVVVPGWAGGTLGAMATYGTSPGAVLVPGVNAFITNVPAVSQSGTWNIGTVTTVTAVTAITNALPAGSNVIGHVITDTGSTTAVTGTVTTSIAPVATSGGALSRLHSSSAAAGNIKASAGNLYGLVLGNSGSVDCWLQLFNNAGTPTAGTSVIDSIMVQAGVTVPIPPGIFALQNFATGIAYAGATTDSGATTTGCTTTFSVSAYYQ